MSTNIYKGGGGVQKVQNLVYVENGCPLIIFSIANLLILSTFQKLLAFFRFRFEFILFL